MALAETRLPHRVTPPLRSMREAIAAAAEPEWAERLHTHAADERVPAAALDFGAAAIEQVLRRYPGSPPARPAV